MLPALAIILLPLARSPFKRAGHQRLKRLGQQRDGATNMSRLPGSGCAVTLVQQVSRAACVEGRTYGCTASPGQPPMVWVSNSCRGTFQCTGRWYGPSYNRSVDCFSPPGHTAYACACLGGGLWLPEERAAASAAAASLQPPTRQAVTSGTNKKPTRREPRPPPHIVPSCTTNASVQRPGEAGGVSRSEDDGLIHVAFYDTRAPQRRNWMGVLRAAAMLDGPGVRLHALLASPLPPSVPAHIRVAALELRSPGARCLHANLVRLSHGPGRTYLLKPLLHFVLPPSVRRVLVLDTDVVMIRPLAELWGQFARFGPEAVLGLVAEQSSLYPGNAIGKNGGVQLLHLERMRRSPAYAAALDHYATGRGGAWLGYLGDQTLYSFMAYSHGALFHSLGCEWNRQLSVHFGLEAQRQHACAAPCGLLHANSPDLKCIGTAMQLANGSCVEWRRLQRNSSCVRNRGVGAKFRTAAATYFASCCL